MVCRSSICMSVCKLSEVDYFVFKVNCLILQLTVQTKSDYILGTLERTIGGDSGAISIGIATRDVSLLQIFV